MQFQSLGNFPAALGKAFGTIKTLNWSLGSFQVLRFFENLVHPYPDQNGQNLPRHFTTFVWRCTKGLRPLIFGMMLCTAIIGSFEAILYSLLGHLIDWLSHVEPSQLWQQEKTRLYLITGVLLLNAN